MKNFVCLSFANTTIPYFFFPRRTTSHPKHVFCDFVDEFCLVTAVGPGLRIVGVALIQNDVGVDTLAVLLGDGLQRIFDRRDRNGEFHATKSEMFRRVASSGPSGEPVRRRR